MPGYTYIRIKEASSKKWRDCCSASRSCTCAALTFATGAGLRLTQTHVDGKANFTVKLLGAPVPRLASMAGVTGQRGAAARSGSYPPCNDVPDGLARFKIREGNNNNYQCSLKHSRTARKPWSLFGSARILARTLLEKRISYVRCTK